MQKLPRGVRAGLVPAKTYEYLASERPILGAAPEGDVRDLLIQAGNSTVCDPDDVECLTKSLEREIAAWQAGVPAPLPLPEVISRFSREHVAEAMARLLDDVVRKR